MRLTRDSRSEAETERLEQNTARKKIEESVCVNGAYFPPIPQCSINRTNSATECAFIFCIRWAR